MSRHTALLAFTLTLATAAPADAGQHGPWITAWHASPQPTWDAHFALPTNVPPTLSGQSVREVLRLGYGGRRLRVVLSNRYGTTPLQLGAVHVARAAGDGGRIVAGSDRALSFGGAGTVSVPPGASVTSDALDWPVAALDTLAVTSWLPQPTATTTFHWGAQQTAYIGAGLQTGAVRLAGGTPVSGRLFLRSVLVEADAAADGRSARGVVVLGDSLTDGNGSTPDHNRRWPDWLATRLAPHGLAVSNAGISGARLLSDGMGQSAAARFADDVLAQPGVASVVVMLGSNDIGWPGSAFAPDAAPMTAAALIAGYRQLIALAHSHGLRIIGSTLPPFEGALHGTSLDGYASGAKEQVRQAVNRWLRSAGSSDDGFDGLLDADAVLRDPAHPARLRPAYDSGDHLHPGDAGYRALADAVDVSLVRAP